MQGPYSRALVDAIAAEDDSDDWSELQRHHELQRKARQSTSTNVDVEKTIGRDGKARKSEPVTIERVERGLALCAYLIELDGPVTVPMFERLERELAAMRQTQDTVSRARRLLENLSGYGAARITTAP